MQIKAIYLLKAFHWFVNKAYTHTITHTHTLTQKAQFCCHPIIRRKNNENLPKNVLLAFNTIYFCSLKHYKLDKHLSI